jgi:hypothetical protein
VAIAELEVTAKALAEATAVAISYAYASCKVNGGYACAVAGTEIKETAYAVARSYASLWAGAIRCKDKCNVGVDAVVEAVGSILVKAASDAFAGGCSGGLLHVTCHLRCPPCCVVPPGVKLKLHANSASFCFGFAQHHASRTMCCLDPQGSAV